MSNFRYNYVFIESIGQRQMHPPAKGGPISSIDRVAKKIACILFLFMDAQITIYEEINIICSNLTMYF